MTLPTTQTRQGWTPAAARTRATERVMVPRPEAKRKRHTSHTGRNSSRSGRCWRWEWGQPGLTAVSKARCDGPGCIHRDGRGGARGMPAVAHRRPVRISSLRSVPPLQVCRPCRRSKSVIRSQRRYRRACVRSILQSRSIRPRRRSIRNGACSGKRKEPSPALY